MISQDHLQFIWQCHIDFLRLMRDLTPPTGLVLFSQWSKSPEMLRGFGIACPYSSFAKLPVTKSAMPLWKPGNSGNGEENFVWLLSCGRGTQDPGSSSSIQLGLPGLCLCSRTPATEICFLMSQCHQKTFSKASLWVRPLPDQPVFWDCFMPAIFICKLLLKH